MRLSAGTVLAFLLLALLTVSGLNDFGLLGPDEPRYASIGREMAQSGDWITPRLWGEPWFEKPALLYWLVAIGNVVGLPGEWAPRLPVVLVSAGFLILYWKLLQEQLGRRAASMATVILATSAAWIGYSRLALTDLPLTAFFAAGMLLSMEWMLTGNPRRLYFAGACFGLAILAKGPVTGILALPLIWETRTRWRNWWRIALPALVIAAPWYVLCAMRNGAPFFNEFFLRHNLGRFTSLDLQHGQPFWYYIPVFVAGLFPWSPLLILLRRPTKASERFFLLWVAFGILFFSLSVNKLPGYLLPLFPAAAALLGIATDRAERSRYVLATAAALLGLTPWIAAILPEAVSSGTTRALAVASWVPAIPFVLLSGLAVWLVEKWKGKVFAFAGVAAIASIALLYLVRTAAPTLDQQVSARRRTQPACLANVSRGLRYGLNHYAGRELPDCVE